MLQDIFVENIVKKKKSISLKLLQVLIILTSIVLALVLLTVGLLFLSGLAGVALLLACGVVYGAYILATSFNLEYETCFTNGALDVDKIINRRRRKRLISLKCKDIETMGRYKKVDHENKQYKTRIIACDSVEALARTNAKRVHLQGKADLTALRPELRDLQQTESGASFLYGGDVRRLLQVLASQPVEDLSVSEPDLEEIFLHYYTEGGEEK